MKNGNHLIRLLSFQPLMRAFPDDMPRQADNLLHSPQLMGGKRMFWTPCGWSEDSLGIMDKRVQHRHNTRSTIADAASKPWSWRWTTWSHIQSSEHVMGRINTHTHFRVHGVHASSSTTTKFKWNPLWMEPLSSVPLALLILWTIEDLGTMKGKYNKLDTNHFCTTCDSPSTSHGAYRAGRTNTMPTPKGRLFGKYTQNRS